MAVLPILRMGHPNLRKKSRNLALSEIKSPTIQKLIADMRETMKAADGVGLAAPQVDFNYRLAVIEFDQYNTRYADLGTQGFTIFINPKIKLLSTEEAGFWEGCLSVPGLRGFVNRPQKIEVEYLDENAEAHKLVAEGFLATVLQHEFDHLDGVLYIDRIKDTKLLAFQDEFRQFILKNPEEDIEP